MLELAEAQGVEAADARTSPQLTRLLQAGKRTRNLGDYLKIFDITLSVMQERDALYRVAYELAEDAPPRTSATSRCATRRSCTASKRLAFEEIVDAVIAGLRDAGRKLRHVAPASSSAASAR